MPTAQATKMCTGASGGSTSRALLQNRGGLQSKPALSCAGEPDTHAQATEGTASLHAGMQMHVLLPALACRADTDSPERFTDGLPEFEHKEGQQLGQGAAQPVELEKAGGADQEEAREHIVLGVVRREGGQQRGHCQRYGRRQQVLLLHRQLTVKEAEGTRRVHKQLTMS